MSGDDTLSTTIRSIGLVEVIVLVKGGDPEWVSTGVSHGRQYTRSIVRLHVLYNGSLGILPMVHSTKGEALFPTFYSVKRKREHPKKTV